MQFTAQTKQAQAQIAALNAQMKALQSQQMLMNKMSSATLSRGLKGPTMMDFNLRGQLGQLDELTKRIQKGKISQKEFSETLRGTNKLYEYQNALQKANLSNIQKMGSQRFRTGINIPELQATSGWLKRNAVEFATASAAAKAYGRQVMDTGKNMAFMGRQAMLSITAPLLLIGAGTAAAFYKVDQQLTNLQKVYGEVGAIGQASASDIREAARGMAQELNRQYAMSEKDTLSLAASFAALGESGRNLDDMTAAAARLMRLGDVSVDSSMKMISTLRTVFKLEGDALEDAINTANTFENSSTLTMQDFSDALPKMGSIVRSWNGDIRQAGEILEGFTRKGIPAVEGANALKAGFTKLVRPTTILEKKWGEMTGGAVESLREMTAQFDGDVPKILERIGQIQKAQGWDGAKVKEFAAQLWGGYQLNRGMALTESLANPTEQMRKIREMTDKEFKEYNKQVADREVAVQMKSSSNQFKQTLNEIQMYAEKFGEKVLPMITNALKTMINLVSGVYQGFSKVFDVLGPLGDAIIWVGKVGLVAAAAFGPLMLALSSFFLIKGGLITVAGIFGGLIAKMRGAKGVTLFQSGSERAAELQSKRMETMRNAETAATQRLTAAIQQLNSTYANGRTPTQMAQSAATKSANATVSNANRVSSALNTQTTAISRNNRALASPQRRNNLGGLVMSNNNFGNPARPAVTTTTNPTNPAYGQRIQQAPAPVMPPIPVVNSARQQSAIINQGRRDAQAYTNAFSQTAARATSQRQQALNQSFVSPGRNSTIAGQATEAARRQAAGLNLPGAASSQANAAAARAARPNPDAGRIANVEQARSLAMQEQQNRQQAALNEKYKASVGHIGGAVVGLGFISTLLAGTNKTLQTVATSLMIVGTAAMIMPGLFSKAAVAVKAMAVSLVGAARMTSFITTLGAMASAAVAPLLIAAAAGAALYGVYRIVTSEARKLREEGEKIQDSAKGLSKVLGYTRTQFGQIKNAAGEVKDTVRSLAKEFKDDENLNAVINRLKREAGNVNDLRATLEQEAMKFYADGANAAQVQTSIEALLEGANITPTIKKQLLIEFENVKPTGLNGTNLSDVVSSKMDDIFKREDNTVSWWQQVMNDEGGDNNKLSMIAKGELNEIYNQMQNGIQNAEKPEDKGNVIKSYVGAFSDRIASELLKLSPEVNKKIEEAGGFLKVDINSLGLDGELEDQLTYNQNLIKDFLNRIKTDYGNDNVNLDGMFDDLGTAMVAMAANGGAALGDYDSAWKSFNNTVSKMGADWTKLDIEDQVDIMNLYRAANGFETLSFEEGKAALEAHNIGNRSKAAAGEIAGMTEESDALNESLNADGKVGDWEKKITITIETQGGGMQDIEMNAQDLVDARKDTYSKVMDDVADEMAAEAQIQFDAQKRAFSDMQQAQSDALAERQSAESKAASKADDLEKKTFNKDWEAKIENETKAYDDRVKVIEDQQKVEDELERQRKRNADRESRRLKYLQSLMQAGIDMNIAMAGGNLDEVARLSLNGATAAQDFNDQNVEAEAGYAKEDADKVRSEAIDKINEEKDARIKSLQAQKEMEEEAMNDRIEMRQEELRKKQEAESKYLQRKQEDENIAYEISFQANQRSLNRELEALRTQIPLNEAELAKHMARLGLAYDDHGVSMMSKGDFWAKTIEDSLINRTRNATETMSNEQMWKDFGNRVATGISEGAFSMNAQQFNNFLRTGDMPDAPVGNAASGAQAGAAFGIRHGGGPIGVGQDKYNNRAGIPMNAPMRSNEQKVLAQKGEFMMQRKAHETYGTETMQAVNNGSAVIIRHGGGPIGDNMGAMGGGIQAAMMGALVSRAALAAGQAMLQAKSSMSMGYSGGGPDIDVGGAGGGYGLRNGANISYGAAGFPQWVYSLANAKGVQASTYPGHQEGDRNEPGYAPNPGRLNRGIDWSGSVPAMQSFAEYLLGIAPRTPTLEQIIWQNPNTGQKIGWHGRQRDDGSYFASDYGGHTDHVHTRSNGPIQPGEGVVAGGGGSVAPAASDDIKKKFPQYSDWTTKGIDKYRDNAMAKFAPVYSYGGAGNDIEKGTFNGPVVEAVKEAVKPRGWDSGRQWDALYQLIAHESSWDPTASAWPASDAYGLFQFLSTTWATVGGQKTSDPYQQAVYGARYIASPTSPAANNGFSRDPVGAWGFWNSHYPNWYDKGGMADGIGYMAKNTLKPERVLSPQQTKSFNDLIPMLDGLRNQGIVRFTDIASALQSDVARMKVPAMAGSVASNESNYEINVTIKDANIIGVDDLDARFKEWSDAIVKRVSDEQTKKERRTGSNR